MSEAKNEIEAVICDIDGCLSPESSAPMQAPRLTELAEWNKARDGRGIVLCSGRPQPFVEAMCRLLGCALPCVAENGVWVYHPEGNRYEMDPSISERDLEAVESARGWVRRELHPRGFVMQPGKTASISLYHDDTALLQGSMDEVRRAFEREGWALRVSSTHLYINCDLEHVNKGTGLDRLLAGAGLEKSRLIGVGDTESDFAIAERAARFGCPANARAAVKARADYVSRMAEIEGVLDVIRTLA